jgi:hypothetical protein
MSNFFSRLKQSNLKESKKDEYIIYLCCETIGPIIPSCEDPWTFYKTTLIFGLLNCLCITWIENNRKKAAVIMKIVLIKNERRTQYLIEFTHSAFFSPPYFSNFISALFSMTVTSSRSSIKTRETVLMSPNKVPNFLNRHNIFQGFS